MDQILPQSAGMYGISHLPTGALSRFMAPESQGLDAVAGRQLLQAPSDRKETRQRLSFDIGLNSCWVFALGVFWGTTPPPPTRRGGFSTAEKQVETFITPEEKLALIASFPPSGFWEILFRGGTGCFLFCFFNLMTRLEQESKGFGVLVHRVK